MLHPTLAVLGWPEIMGILVVLMILVGIPAIVLAIVFIILRVTGAADKKAPASAPPPIPKSE